MQKSLPFRIQHPGQGSEPNCGSHERPCGPTWLVPVYDKTLDPLTRGLGVVTTYSANVNLCPYHSPSDPLFPFIVLTLRKRSNTDVSLTTHHVMDSFGSTFQLQPRLSYHEASSPPPVLGTLSASCSSQGLALHACALLCSTSPSNKVRQESLRCCLRVHDFLAKSVHCSSFSPHLPSRRPSTYASRKPCII